jgi:hypothetical protein
MKRVCHKIKPIQASQFDGGGPRFFQCRMEYEPGRAYGRQDLIDLIRPHAELLCFFAESARVKRCVLGVDFDGYDPASRMVPVYVMTETEAQRMVRFEGAEFRWAYRRSGYGRSIIVTFTGEWWRGWFELAWAWPKYRREMRVSNSNGMD